ncbi:MAG: CYTH domain-containing protein [Bacteroidales bacterium]|nr:CYTH domain-containing protein [Bacteroidales bacterium]
MPLEIERKFLIAGDFRPFVCESFRIAQGYLCCDARRTVRVRVKGDVGYITVKGKSKDGGLSRFEWEKEISRQEAEALLPLCEPGIIDKFRHLVEFEGHTFEVDEFLGENEGLVLAELELSSVDEYFLRPEWLGEEVTGDRRYYNSYLSVHPFKTW